MNNESKALIEKAIELLNEAQGDITPEQYQAIQDTIYTLQDLIEE